MFIRGETLSAHSARPRKIPGWIVVVRENLSVNKRVCSKQKQLKLHEGGFVCFPIQNFFGFHSFHLKKLKIVQLKSD